jgi:hypothetical protein
MNSKSLSLDLVIRAVLKLDPHNGERQNVTAFIKSCYAGKVGDYDFDAALASLGNLTDEEQHALITYVMERA